MSNVKVMNKTPNLHLGLAYYTITYHSAAKAAPHKHPDRSP